MAGKRPVLAEIGELEFIKRISGMMPSDGGTIIRSVGDDCLVAESSGELQSLYTTDTFVDGVHFTADFAAFEEIGKRCMAASVSDIAAMSGLPSYSLVSLSMPGDMAFDNAVSLFEGLSSAAERYCCPIGGGETTSTPGPLTVTVTVIGSVEPERVKTRSGAQEGEGVFVTGFIGDAMAGLLAFQEGFSGYRELKRKFLTPEARVELSRKLTESYDISAMIDLSDGIASDLFHICEESGAGADINAGSIPLSGEFRKLMENTGHDPVDFAMTSGEDFELLFTSGDDSLPDSITVAGLPVTRIGTVTGSSEGITVRFPDGSGKKLAIKGYEHFRS